MKIKYTKGQMAFVIIWMVIMASVVMYGFIQQDRGLVAIALVGMMLPVLILQTVAIDQIRKEIGALKEDKK